MSKTKIKMLIDTNIVIAAEDHSSPQGHVDGTEASKLIGLAQQLGIMICVSAGTKSDIARAPEPRRQARIRQLERYAVLAPIPIDEHFANRAGFPAHRGENDAADLEVLSALTSGAVDFLATQDSKLRSRAARVAPGENVLSLAEANDWLASLLSRPSSIPAISLMRGYSIPLDAQIFDSLRETYPGFDVWWKARVAHEDRDVALIGDNKDPLAIAVFKPETDGPEGPILKICTFKARSDQAGHKLGEQLLKGCLDYARRNEHDSVYMEVNPTSDLVGWLDDFGFYRPGRTANNGDLVFVKNLTPQAGHATIEPLKHAIAYGPGSALVKRAFIVPIQHRWHEVLFPEVPTAASGGTVQLTLLPEPDRPCGNAIRKAYLSSGNTTKIQAGDFLTFLRTGDGPSQVTVTGVVEEVLRSSDPVEVIEFVGVRTVYSRDEIASRCQKRPVLAIRFRLDRVLDEEVGSSDLIAQGVIKGSPQSITQLREKGVQWARELTA